MNISSPFIRRPVGTALLTGAVALAGAVAYLELPVAPLPQVEFPTISVSANLPGASPEIMASSVAAPLERQLGHIAGVNEMTSASYFGSTSVTLQFDLNRDIDGAARDVQAAINAARANLPSDLPANPSYRKLNPTDSPIIIIGLTSDIYDRGKLYDEASSIIQQRLLQIEGVGQVLVGGGALPAVRVDVNPTQLNSFGLGLEDVRTALNQQNANLPKGQLANGNMSADILANDQLLRAADYAPLIIAYRNGAPVRLSDVANVEEGVENIRAAGYLNGVPSIPLIIFRQPGANIIETVDRIKAALPSLKASMPSGINFIVVLDRSTTIRTSVREIERTLVIAICLVILVVFAFLRSPRATLIPAVVVPVSLIGTFAVMYLLGFSVDNLSLMALTISTGFVVDDAIVVIENVSRHMEAGMTPMAASIRGAKEVGFTVLSISISLIAVFLPILLMGGIVGRYFREFAVVLSTAIIISLLVSLTTTPMMCSRILRYRRPEDHGHLYQKSESVFRWLLDHYESSLRVVLRHPAITLVVLIVTIAVNVLLFAMVPKGLFPLQDNGTIAGSVQGSQDASFHMMQTATSQFINLIKQDSAVDNVIGFTGGGFGPSDSANVYLALKPLQERKISASALIDRMRPKLARVRNATMFMQAGQDLRIGGRLGRAQYQYTIQSDNLADLVEWGPKFLAAMRKLPGFTDVNSDQENNGLQASLVIDRPTAERLGVSAELLDNTLYDAFGQRQVSTMYTSLNQYHVVLEVTPQFWESPQGLDDIYVRSTNGPVVPLGAIAHYETTTAPIAVNHQGQFAAVTMSFNLKPGVSLSQAIEKINQMERDIGLPGRIHGSPAGTLQAYQQTAGTELLLIIVAILAVYIVLGILYESYIHPITILSTLPSGGVGAMLALKLFGTDLTIIAIIGILLLIGIVKKNAILMVDFALAAERESHQPPAEAIFQACILRFRPILMTTMSALFGALPLVLSRGIGSELRQPLGITIVGGLIMSQALTLYTTPVVYLYFDRIRLWFDERRNARLAGQVATLLILLVGIGCMTGCSFAPKYKKPAVEAAPAFKELTPEQAKTVDGWKTAEPQDDRVRGNWWEMFGDTNLNTLEEQVTRSNQTVIAAFQNFIGARAVIKQTRSELFPTVTTDPSVTRSKNSATSGLAFSNSVTGSSGTGGTGTFTRYSLPFDATWEPDFWGNIRNQLKANKYQAQASFADLVNSLLTVQAEAAADYFQILGLDSQKELLASNVVAFEESLRLTQARHDTGIASDQDVAQAETQLDTTRAQETDLGIQRAQLEHAIATLTGQSPSLFSLPIAALTMKPVAVPLGIPSQLLERRPDIAAAERSTAAANAQIGVARAAYFPTVTLSGSVGYNSTRIEDLFTGPAFGWSLGASALETLFDAGKRRAVTEQAWATYRSQVATYRQTVLSAFQDVEDNLASLRILSKEIGEQDAAVAASKRYRDLSNDRYRLGIDSYLNVITAQTSYLNNQRTALTLRTSQMTANVQLIKALGGGWDDSQLPDSLSKKPKDLQSHL